ncbi:hypothetical protein [Citrobacter freundii]|uniref:hypothetical protein n=1 Tax=Citrobacter freundii TaxID=546 RepID=UPI00190006F4|nr:hypothetical protein [Citrobacter freundii]MBJ9313120.1 hypothetical protein [Citrobacter freundii]HEI8943239.1 hypothetical protein [Citrobacter freundii]HEJ0170282.1 hypothetical protein [Citrobacter freundii]
MARYIAVIHGWHVHSKGFTVHQLTSADRDSAEKDAAYLCSQRQKPFCECAYLVVEVADSETLLEPRNLTLRERLTGRTYQ